MKQGAVVVALFSGFFVALTYADGCAIRATHLRVRELVESGDVEGVSRCMTSRFRDGDEWKENTLENVAYVFRHSWRTPVLRGLSHVDIFPAIDPHRPLARYLRIVDRSSALGKGALIGFRREGGTWRIESLQGWG